MNTTIQKIQNRSEMRDIQASKGFASLVHKVASGRELTAEEIDAMENYAEQLGIDDPATHFVESVELVKSVAERERLHPDFAAETTELLRQAEEAGRKRDELRVESIRQNGIAYQKRVEADCMAADGAKLERDKNSRPDLFADFEMMKKKK